MPLHFSFILNYFFSFFFALFFLPIITSVFAISNFGLFLNSDFRFLSSFFCIFSLFYRSFRIIPLVQFNSVYCKRCRLRTNYVQEGQVSHVVELCLIGIIMRFASLAGTIPVLPHKQRSLLSVGRGALAQVPQMTTEIRRFKEKKWTSITGSWKWSWAREYTAYSSS